MKQKDLITGVADGAHGGPGKAHHHHSSSLKLI